MTITKDQLTWKGRCLDSDGVRFFNWTASSFEFAFTGKKAVACITSDPENWKKENLGWIGVFVADLDKDYHLQADNRFELSEKENQCVLFESDTEKTVKIRVMKISENAFGMAGFKSLEIDGNLKELPAPNYSMKLEYIGDSITCGYGIDGVWEKDVFRTDIERADKGYAYLTARKLNADYNMISWSGIGLSSTYVDPSIELPENNWTMPRTWPYTDKHASILLKKDPEVWDSSKYKPDFVIINLGTNDQSWTRDKEERTLTFINLYRGLIEEVHRRSPEAKIICCLGVMGQLLCPAIETAVNKFKAEFPSAKIKTLTFPVQLESDGIAADWHPSAVTHEKMSQKLSEFIKAFK
ncbi:MAG: GDSL-type esterase/lipase family protein [Treponema sp.]|nr:GDSL-type esterase/lipase family protein [Treponema sp.]